MKLSKRANRIQPSVTVELNAKVAQMLQDGMDIVKMNIGEPDFGTPQNIRDASKEAIDNGFTRYTAVSGILDLRKAICQKLKKDNGIEYLAENICVSTGAKQAIMNAVLTLVDEGDEVIIPIPCWVSYESMVEIAGGVAVTVPTKEDFHLDIPKIEEKINDKTKAIIINTPNNPTGVVYTKQELEKLAALAIKYDIMIISDEVYEKLIYEDAKHISPAALSQDAWEHVITINGVSKSYAMTGWRIGYLAAPKVIAKKASGLQGHMTSATNSIAQKAALEALTGPQDSVETMRQEFDKRRQAMYERLNQIEGITCENSCGAFYLMPDVSAYYGKTNKGQTITNSVEMAGYLLEEAQVAVVPGDGFRAPKNLRLSYSNSMENLMRGLDRIEDALKKLK
ncbi:pyridoxal phosphate-dependent aminotransferase [Clostridium sp. AF20-17LB]|nr:pyridoxal phosphate-dependent aminotransferase [Clostridium sp. AF20-17LB]RHR04974.1 pyridoxal phosphate-dependent aminotransferase [Clostridium sp. AF20-17LB]